MRELLSILVSLTIFRMVSPPLSLLGLMVISILSTLLFFSLKGFINNLFSIVIFYSLYLFPYSFYSCLCGHIGLHSPGVCRRFGLFPDTGGSNFGIVQIRVGLYKAIYRRSAGKYCAVDLSLFKFFFFINDPLIFIKGIIGGDIRDLKIRFLFQFLQDLVISDLGPGDQDPLSSPAGFSQGFPQRGSVIYF